MRYTFTRLLDGASVAEPLRPFPLFSARPVVCQDSGVRLLSCGENLRWTANAELTWNKSEEESWALQWDSRRRNWR